MALDPQPSNHTASDENAGPQQSWFTENILPHENALRCWLKARFPDLVDSEDVVQDSYVRVWRTREPARITDGKSYLFSTAKNLVLDLFRKRQRSSLIASNAIDVEAVPSDQTDIQESANVSQEYEILMDAIRSLPARCREIMTLQKLDGLSNHEIANRLNLSVNTVNAQLVIGLARCRTFLKARGIFRGRAQ